VARLRAFVHAWARAAAARPSIPRPLSGEWRLYSPFHEPPVDRLILDPLKPLAEQTEALHAQLFVGLMAHYRSLVIGWEPAHRVPGQFVIRRYQDDPERWDLNENDEEGDYPRPSWQLPTNGDVTARKRSAGLLKEFTTGLEGRYFPPSFRFQTSPANLIAPPPRDGTM
jgi:hypothetical protein